MFSSVSTATEANGQPDGVIGVQAEEFNGVVPKRVGHRPDTAGQNHGQLGPAEQEADAAAEGPRQVNVIAAHPRVRRCQFGVAQRSEQRQDAAQQPAAHPQPRAMDIGEDVLRRLENGSANDNPHNDADGIPESEMSVRGIVVRLAIVGVGHYTGIRGQEGQCGNVGRIHAGPERN